jgi:hypothetical protein
MQEALIMAKRSLVIAPRLTLPVKPMKKRSRRSRTQTVATWARIIVCSLIALDLGNMAYWYLAPWPVYRIVAFVVLGVLWSNCASASARHKTKHAWEMLNTATMQAVHAVPRKQTTLVKPATGEDTATYLHALKVELVGYENIQTDRLYNTVPDDTCYRDNICNTQTAPIG